MTRGQIASKHRPVASERDDPDAANSAKAGVAQRFVQALRVVLYRVARLLPIRFNSACMSLWVRASVRLTQPEVVANARRNLKHHRPWLTEAELEQGVTNFLDNVGRFMGELASLPRIASENRIEVINAGPPPATVAREPVVAIHLHLGNWEALGAGLRAIGMKVATFYQLRDDPVERLILEDARRNIGFDLLSPDLRGFRDAFACLKRCQPVAIACDESRAGLMMAPFFGRPPHDKGNLAVAARLARRASASVVIVYCERLPRCRYRMHLLAPVKLPEANSGLLDDVAFLNALIEPIILANIDRWYYLDNPFGPVD